MFEQVVMQLVLQVLDHLIFDMHVNDHCKVVLAILNFSSG